MTAALGMQWGEEKAVCQSCQRERLVTDMGRVYMDDDYFLLCDSVEDVQPSCWAKYQAGRERFGRDFYGRKKRHE